MQERLLTEQDCLALLACPAEIDGLAFYIAGPVAEASQRHTHVQIEPSLHQAQVTGPTGIMPALPFLHAYAPMDPRWFDSPMESAPLLLVQYQALLRHVQVPIQRTPDGLRTGPYNLLVTRQWISAMDNGDTSIGGMFRRAFDQCVGLCGRAIGEECGASGPTAEPWAHDRVAASRLFKTDFGRITDVSSFRTSQGEHGSITRQPRARSLPDLAVRDEAKEVWSDARPQARKSRRRIRWNPLRIVHGRERRR